MPVIGPDQQPPRTFPSRLQRYWEHPHPYGLIAMLKSTLDSIDDAVNGSIAATGAPPSTEDEAFRYNQARDRGAIGAFHAAADFSPAAPEFAGAALGRRAISGPVPQAIEGRFPHVGSLPRPNGAAPYSSARPEAATRGWQPSTPGGSVPSVPPPAVGATPSGGLLARLRELDALERQQPGTNVGPASLERGPNFRELRRILVQPFYGEGVVAGGEPLTTTQSETDAESFSDTSLGYPEWLARKNRSYNPSKRSYSGGGGRGAGGDGGGRRGGRRGGWGGEDPCEERERMEIAECWDRWVDPVHPHYPWGCTQRTMDRKLWCEKHGIDDPGGPRKWTLGDEETWRNYGR